MMEIVTWNIPLSNGKTENSLLSYWEFDFEAVCPTLDHDLLSQAHIQIALLAVALLPY